VALETLDELLAATPADPAWESFHENSKTSRRERHSIYPLPPSDAAIVAAMNRLRTVKPYRDFQHLALPDAPPAPARSFDEVLEARETARSFGSAAVPLAAVARVLRTAYGVARQAGPEYPRPFRYVPSGGALFPLEIYLQALRVDGLEPGLYHYDPEAHELDVLRRGDETDRLAASVFQPGLLRAAAAAVFVSAVFFRSTFKYGDRGYRFVLLEAGHLAQNALLTAGATGLAAAPIGGYLDREVDRYLGLDGLTESVVYMLLLGEPAGGEPAEAPR
jgi:SagB-type dehydrogenase family enzyme